MEISANKRLDAVRVMLDKKQINFCEELQCHPNTYINVIKEKSKIPTDWLTYISRKYNISPTWVLLGKGELFC